MQQLPVVTLERIRMISGTYMRTVSRTSYASCVKAIHLYWQLAQKKLNVNSANRIGRIQYETKVNI